MPRQLLERFLRYVQIDTTSDPDSEAYPSTVKQWDLLRLLAGELEEIGAKVNLTPHGYVIADVPATVGCEAVPVVALLAHADTAPDFSGTNVKPIVHRNYQGGALRLPDDSEQVIDPADARYADLLTAVGKDVVTASGGTDGSRLTERGLPTPNIFTGGHNAHGPLEWVAVQDMQIVVDVLVALVRKWVEGGGGFTGYRSTADA